MEEWEACPRGKHALFRKGRWIYEKLENGAMMEILMDGQEPVAMNKAMKPLCAEYVTGSSTMQGVREKQEDRSKIVSGNFLSDFISGEDFHTELAIVADGHVGVSVADFLIDRLPRELRRQLHMHWSEFMVQASPTRSKRNLDPADDSTAKRSRPQGPVADGPSAGEPQARSADRDQEQKLSPAHGKPDMREASAGPTPSEREPAQGRRGEQNSPKAAADAFVESPDYSKLEDGNELADAGLADGDLPDGDLPDGDLRDGDLRDGDLRDGDLPDGDLADAERASTCASTSASVSSEGCIRLSDVDEIIRAACRDAFLKVDGEYLRMNRTSKSGATCTVAVLLGDTLAVANVGDTKCIMAQCNANGTMTPERLSVDHKPGDPEEQKRIEGEGGSVRNVKGCVRVFPKMNPAKVDGRGPIALAVSRAFGDRQLKMQKLVIAEPHISIRRIDKASAVVIATDGVWDVLGEDAVAGICEKFYSSRDAHKAAGSIVTTAYQAGSQDNITCIVYFFYL